MVNLKKSENAYNVGTIALLFFYLALYTIPYFRAVFGVPSWVAARELLLGLLVILMLYKGATLKIPVWFFLYVILLLSSFLASENRSIALVTLTILIRFVFIYIFTTNYIKTDEQKLLFCRLFYILGIIGLFLILLQGVLGPIPVINMYLATDESSMRFGMVRLSTIYGDTISSAMLLLIFLFQVIYIHKRGIFKVSLILLISVSIVLTVSKAPITILAVTIMFLLIKKLIEITVISKIIVLLLLMTTVLVLKPYVYQEIEDAIYAIELIDKVNTSDQFTSDTKSRLFEKPQEIFNTMMDRGFPTLIIGAGFDVAGQAAATEGDGIRPHNAIIEIFATMGFAGVFIYCYIFLAVARIALVIKPTTLTNKHLKGLASGVVAALISALFVDLHVTNVLMVPTFFLLAVAGGDAARHPQYTESNKVNNYS